MFSPDVEPNPSTNTVYKGLERFVDFQPDVIIALGGGSAMDAAKAMWMFFEHPDVSFFGAKQNSWISVNVPTRFLTLRRHIYLYPNNFRYRFRSNVICGYH